MCTIYDAIMGYVEFWVMIFNVVAPLKFKALKQRDLKMIQFFLVWLFTITLTMLIIFISLCNHLRIFVKEFFYIKTTIKIIPKKGALSCMDMTQELNKCEKIISSCLVFVISNFSQLFFI